MRRILALFPKENRPLYILSGLVGFISALTISSSFIKQSFSQTPSTSPNPTEQTLGIDPNIPKIQPPITSDVDIVDIPMIRKELSPLQELAIREGIIEEFRYESKGRRDPFLPYLAPRPEDEVDEIISPLQRFDLDQLKLVGILWDTRNPKAMFMDPNQKGYIVKKMDKIGRQRGFVAEIRDGEVVIVEKTYVDEKPSFITRVLRLNTRQ